MDTAARLGAPAQGTHHDQSRNPASAHALCLVSHPNLAWRNRRDLTFRRVGAQWGFHDPVCRTVWRLADLDNDGDLDVLVNNLNAAAGLYRTTPPLRAWPSGSMACPQHARHRRQNHRPRRPGAHSKPGNAMRRPLPFQ